MTGKSKSTWCLYYRYSSNHSICIQWSKIWLFYKRWKAVSGNWTILKRKPRCSNRSKIYICKNNVGELIQLDNVVFVEEQSAPPQLFRFNRYVSATVSAGLAPGVSLGEGIDVMQGVADKVLDERFATALDGTSKILKVHQV